MYAKVESERLLYIRLNQQKLRVEDYIHLRDAVTNDGAVSDIGRTVILPATFMGSMFARTAGPIYLLVLIHDGHKLDIRHKK
jgi:hypothetical protein